MANIDEISKELEQGVKSLFTSERYRAYLDCMSRFRNYSFNNTVLIFCQMPTATLVAGYGAWRDKFKRQVKRGEKAIKILAPCPHKKVREVENEDGTTEEREIRWTSFRAVNVFDVSQTEGDALPTICERLSGSVDVCPDAFDRLRAISSVPVDFEDISSGANGYYSPSENRIVIQSGMSDIQSVKTLAHEMAHSILHCPDGDEKSADRRTREVQAESVAYIVCSALGLDTSEYSFGYVAGWSECQELNELSDSMDAIRKTAGQILDLLNAA